MSGHSKWSTIKRQKAVTDNRRSAAFTKLARQITIAARQGGGDPTMNFRLRLSMDKARAANMPNDNIDRAVKSGTGADREALTKEVIYEGFGPGGVAVMVEALTDNGNRTAAAVRSTFTKHGGTLGSQHSVAWMFARQGVCRVPLTRVVADRRQEIELALIDAGADDVREVDGQLQVITPPPALETVRQVFINSALERVAADVEFMPTTTVMVDEATREKLYELFGALEDLDDVTSISSNEA